MVNKTRIANKLNRAKELIDHALVTLYEEDSVEPPIEPPPVERPDDPEEPPVEPPVEPPIEPPTGNYAEWRSWDIANAPAFPDRPQPFVMVGENDDPNELARLHYQLNPDDLWVRLVISGRNPHKLRVGGKYGIHRDGKPISVWIDGDIESEVQGIEVDSYGGTFVSELVVDDCAVRKSKGAKAPIEDRAASGNWWFRKFRPRQNYEEAVEHLNYEGAKWGIKPSDGIEQLVVVDSPRVIDPLLGTYPKFWEHYAYLTGVKRYWFVRTDMSGGNRTGFQSNTPRSGGGQWPWEAGDVSVTVDCNIEVGYQWSHSDGGGALTDWEQAAGSVGLFAGNTIRTRYGGITIAHQPGNASQYDAYPLPHNLADADGFVHQGEWWLLDNKIVITEGSRSAISVSSCRKATIAGNEIDHQGGNALPIIIDSGFSIKIGAPRCDPATITIDQPGITVGTYKDGDYVPHPSFN